MARLALFGGPKTVHRAFPSWPIWDRDDKDALLGVLQSGKWWMYAYGEAELGADADAAPDRSQVVQFEEEFARLHRVKHGIAVTNGSMALDICMRAIGLEAGDEVITTPYTFFATSGCILNMNALPIYVDIDPKTYNLDPARIEEAITPRTRAVLPVYFGGELADVDAIARIAARRRPESHRGCCTGPGSQSAGRKIRRFVRRSRRLQLPGFQVFDLRRGRIDPKQLRRHGRRRLEFTALRPRQRRPVV